MTAVHGTIFLGVYGRILPRLCCGEKNSAQDTNTRAEIVAAASFDTFPRRQVHTPDRLQKSDNADHRSCDST